MTLLGWQTEHGQGGLVDAFPELDIGHVKSPLLRPREVVAQTLDLLHAGALLAGSQLRRRSPGTAIAGMSVSVALEGFWASEQRPRHALLPARDALGVQPDRAEHRVVPFVVRQVEMEG
jgi:hypothetical protein